MLGSGETAEKYFVLQYIKIVSELSLRHAFLFRGYLTAPLYNIYFSKFRKLSPFCGAVTPKKSHTVAPTSDRLLRKPRFTP